MSECDNTFLTPVGRFVDGNFIDGSTKDYHGQPIIIKSGNNQGQPGVRFWAAIAFEKDNAEFLELYNNIKKVGELGFPQLFQNGNAPAGFSWKIGDGDSTIPNKKGTILCQKEGYPGNWILNFSTSFAVKIFDHAGDEVIENKGYIKLGDFVRISGSVTANNNSNNPGVYLNMSLAQHVAYGPRIIVSKAKEFDKAPQNLPKGASLTPLEPANAPPKQPQQQPNSAPPLPPQVSNVHPANDILDPKPVVKKYDLDGKMWTELELKQSGWTDNQLSALQQAN